jgi:hypothetical protein
VLVGGNGERMKRFGLEKTAARCGFRRPNLAGLSWPAGVLARRGSSYGMPRFRCSVANGLIWSVDYARPQLWCTHHIINKLLVSFAVANAKGGGMISQYRQQVHLVCT